MAAVLLACGHEVSSVVQIDGEPRCGECEADSNEVIDAMTEPLGEAVEELLGAEPGSRQEIDPESAGTDDEGERQDVDALSEAQAATRASDNGDGADSPPQPVHGTRAEEAGPKGCWATTVAGNPCRAPAVNGGPYCNAHSGNGVAADPLAHSVTGHEARRRNIETRARMRLMLGNVRPDTPRGALKIKAHAMAERLAGRVIDAALDGESDPIRAGSLALRVIETTDPLTEASLEVSGPMDLDKATLPELIAFAQANGISLERDDPTPPDVIDATG